MFASIARTLRLGASADGVVLAQKLNFLLLLASAAVLLVTEVNAFNSFPLGCPHDRLTKEAAKRSRVSENVTHRLMREVRLADWREMGWRPRPHPRTWLRLSGSSAYRPEHHFDRSRGVTSRDAFLSAVQYVSAQTETTIRFLEANEKGAAIRSLGGALHAIQDFFSHSNFVDLSEEEQALLVRILLGSHEPPPTTLELTAYDISAENP